MLLPAPPLFPRRRKPRPKPKRTVPPVALNLVAAEYEESEFLLLTFDRPIDIAGFDAAQIVVDDVGLSGMRWVGVGPGTLSGAASVQVDLEMAGPATGSGTTLTATAANGIVAVGDGAAWGGVTGVTIPFP